MFSVENGRASYDESGRFRGVTPLSWLAIEGGNPDTAPEGVLPLLVEHPTV
jgi:hypothetical protein